MTIEKLLSVMGEAPPKKQLMRISISKEILDSNCGLYDGFLEDVAKMFSVYGKALATLKWDNEIESYGAPYRNTCFQCNPNEGWSLGWEGAITCEEELSYYEFVKDNEDIEAII